MGKKGKKRIYSYKYKKYILKEIDEENDIKNENEDNYVEETLKYENNENDKNNDILAFDSSIFD